MAAHTMHISLIFIMQNILLLQGARILTVSFVGHRRLLPRERSVPAFCINGISCILSSLGGSHFLLMDEISRILHNNGHEVRMFLQIGRGLMPGYEPRTNPYPVTTWSMDENYLDNFEKFIQLRNQEFFMGRSGLSTYTEFIRQLSHQCNQALNQSVILNTLREEQYDIAVIDAFNPCTLLISEKLGLPYIAFFPVAFANALQVGLPTPLSYVPLYKSQLTDRMDFFQRVKNTFMYVALHVVETQCQAIFEDMINEHFPVGSRPSISDLYLKAELWIYNIDFSIEFPRPLLPHVQYIGSLLAKPAKPVSEELEDFISQSGESGFIVVTLGSMVASCPVKDLLMEMNHGFAKIPQKVIWRYECSKWPKDLELAPNVKLMDWISQNDLLGHPKVRLLVTHGGLNSLMEAIYHGVPVLGIPLFADQFDNVVRVKAKHMGTFIPPVQIKAEYFANTLRQIIEDQSYKSSVMKLSVIKRSHPFPPDQQLVRWVEHIIQSGGGGHLRPYGFQQPWYQRYLLDVLLFIAVCLVITIYLVVKTASFCIGKLCSRRKQKQS
ncbi:UDP-glucuronosyltransferase 3A1-like [Pelodytes ibericus]